MNESTIGAYRILRECGRGAFGTVYLAESAISGQRFALKVLHCSRDERELEGLIRCRECRHGNLLQIHHIDRLPDGRLYYTMDAADDRSGGEGQYQPDTLAARGRIPAGELTGILLKLLDGVEELHRHQIIHRDIKPENILFIRGVPVLGDAGLAAASGSAGAAGTPSFLPKEVLSGKRDPDEASDLFALGRTAYAALTGKSPAEYPQLPGDLPAEAAPVLAFCRAANGMDATLASCRAVLNVPSRSNARRCRSMVLLLAVFAAAVAVFAAVRYRFVPKEEKHPEEHSFRETGKSEIPRGRADVPPIRRSRPDLPDRFQELGVDEYLSEAGEILKKYPPVPAPVAKRAKVRYDEIEKEYEAVFWKGLGSKTDREDFLRADAEKRRKIQNDPWYRIAELTRRIDIESSPGMMTPRRGGLISLEDALRRRQELVKRVLEENFSK